MTVAGTILALDAAGHACSVALWRDGRLAAQESLAMSHGQAVELIPMVQRVAEAAGMGLPQLERIAVTIGPGGFTGLRIGLATARGLGLAIGCPVIGISSFQVAAASAAGLSAFVPPAPVPPALVPSGDAGLALPDLALPGPCLVVLDSRRAELFVAELRPDLTFARPAALMTPPEIADLAHRDGIEILLGDGLAPLRSILPVRQPAFTGRMIDAAPGAPAVARLAADPQHRFNLPPDPAYLRPPDISQPKQRPPAPDGTPAPDAPSSPDGLPGPGGKIA